MNNAKNVVKRLLRSFSTNNPFTIAENLNIVVLYCPLKNILGHYVKYCRIKTIIINSNADEHLHRFICAHELAHALLHPDLNTAKLLHISPLANANRYETEANSFAVELLLPDTEIAEHLDWTEEFFSREYGIPIGMMRLKQFSDVQTRIEW